MLEQMVIWFTIGMMVDIVVKNQCMWDRGKTTIVELIRHHHNPFLLMVELVMRIFVLKTLTNLILVDRFTSRVFEQQSSKPTIFKDEYKFILGRNTGFRYFGLNVEKWNWCNYSFGCWESVLNVVCYCLAGIWVNFMLDSVKIWIGGFLTNFM